MKNETPAKCTFCWGTEPCGKNLRKLYCVAHKTLCNSFLPCYLLPLLWWYGYWPVTKRMATEIMQVDCGWRVLRSQAPFYGGRLWVTMFMVNDTFIWNTATISRYSILALVYNNRLFVTVYNIVWHKCVYMYTLKLLALDSFQCFHNVNIRISQSNKCWPVLFLWIHNRIQTGLYSVTTEP